MKKTYFKVFAVMVSMILMFSFTTTNAQTDTAGFKPGGKVWGQAFGDFGIKVHNDSANIHGGKTQYAGAGYPQNYSIIQFRRIYLGYNYNIAPNLSTEVLLSSEPGDVDGAGNRTVYVKLADIRWKNVYKNADIVIGQQATTAFTTNSEPAWGYRSVEKTILDMRGIVKSNDFGVSLQGKLNDKGDYGYNVLISNGSGANPSTEVSQFKKFSADIYGKFADQKLVVDIYGDYSKTTFNPYPQSKNTFKFFVGYVSDPITVGAEAFMQTLANTGVYKDTTVSKTKNDTTNVSPFGLSIFVRGAIIKGKLSFFARYDMYNPDTKFNKAYKYITSANSVTESFLTAGIDWSVNKSFHIIPNIWYDTYTQNAVAVDKGTDFTGRKKTDYDFVPRITFAYTFNK